MGPMRIATFLLLTSITIAQETKPATAPKLQGKWVVTELNMAGNQIDPKVVFGGMTWDIQEDKLTILIGKREVIHHITVDTKQQPAWIDLHPQHPDFIGKVCMGIYKIEGDVLIVCTNARGTGSRPNNFALPDVASGNNLSRLQRMK